MLCFSQVTDVEIVKVLVVIPFWDECLAQVRG